jgi:hypothetical protein
VTMQISTKLKYVRMVSAAAVSITGLYLLSRVNYLLFHCSVEVFSIVIAFAIFAIAWNSRRMMGSNFLLFIGIACLFVGRVDLLHTLAYRGMGVFPEYGSNLATQLWIARAVFRQPQVSSKRCHRRLLRCYCLGARFHLLLVEFSSSVHRRSRLDTVQDNQRIRDFLNSFIRHRLADNKTQGIQRQRSQVDGCCFFAFSSFSFSSSILALMSSISFSRSAFSFANSF